MDDTAREMFARLVRHYRQAAGSKSECAQVTGYSPSYLSRIESGERIPRADVAQDLDEGLGAGGALIEMARVLNARRDSVSLDTEPVDDMYGMEAGTVERRQLLQHAIGLTGAAGLAGTLGQLDAVRITLDDALDRSVEEWEEVAWDYGRDVLTMPPGAILDGLSADVLAVRRLLDRPISASDRSGLQRVAAQLSVLVAMSLGNLGEFAHTRRWWRTAQTAADRSGDLELATWVRGRQVVRGIYEGRTDGEVVAMADRTLARAPQATGAGAMEALTAQAQALARQGSPSAMVAAQHAADAFEEVPATVRGDTTSVYGWAEYNLRHTWSYVYSRTGDDRAPAVHEAALADNPANYYQGRAQIRLHQAEWLVRTGDPTEGLRHASETITALPSRYRGNQIMAIARDVAQALPAGAEETPEAAEYRELLAAPATG